MPIAGELILASQSRIRLEMLRAAGLTVCAVASGVDEAAVKAAYRSAGEGAEAAALELARVKSRSVVDRVSSSLVVSADQILDCEGQWFDKPRDRSDAAGQLRRLAGRTHRLVTGASLLRDGRETWSYCDVATLSMVALDDSTIGRYLDAVGEAAFDSVGAYQIEGRGIGLFDCITGDYFAILGLPLVPLIAALRSQGLTIP